MSTTLYRGGAVVTPAVLAAPGPADAPSALLVADGVVVWVGGADEADGLADAADEVVELDGALVTPGFVDAHAHVLDTGLVRAGVDLGRCGSVAEVLATVHAAVAGPVGRRLAAEGSPLTGWGWAEDGWPEGRPPTREELDAAAGGAPVYLGRVDLHAGVVSTSFAQVLGLRDLPGWRADGLVTGAAHDAARAALRDLPADVRDARCRGALASAAQAGVVAVHEQSAPHTDSRAGLAALLALTADPASGLPLVVGYRAELCETADDVRALAAAVPGLAGVGGDLAADGSLGSRTAALRAPYADVPAGWPHPAGRLDLTAEQVSNHVASATRAGCRRRSTSSGTARSTRCCSASGWPPRSRAWMRCAPAGTGWSTPRCWTRPRWPPSCCSASPRRCSRRSTRRGAGTTARTRRGSVADARRRCTRWPTCARRGCRWRSGRTAR